mmetsp:Transcript_96/g.203  ORF Transcript_96/g.203 Transcript_96/m.203 type:complete len:408 (-) Transcript_96:1403-2626(-)
MYKSRLIQAPVITLLSPSLYASKKAASLLEALGNMTLVSSSSLGEDTTTVETTTKIQKEQDDQLNRAFQSSIPGFSRTWQSVGVVCPESSSVVHFCSMTDSVPNSHNNNNNNNKSKSTKTPFALLAITDSGTETNPKQIIQQCRNHLATQVSSTLKTQLKYVVGGQITPSDLLRDTVSSDGLPWLSMENAIQKDSIANTENGPKSPFLKEIVVPFFDSAVYQDGSTILSKLANAETLRPTVGVYHWPGSSMCIRPLPTAAQDQRLPPPSLIFHHESPDEVTLAAKKETFRTARIGFSGGMNDGQIMILHQDLLGLDIRYCRQTIVSSAFSEAQESLLAGSLEELQSTQTLVAKGEEGSKENDDRIGKGDCWVEVRANLKRPSGYWKRNSSKKAGSVKIAKIPDLPYE